MSILRRRRATRPGWTDEPQIMSIYQWAGLEREEATELEALAARLRLATRFFRTIWFGVMVALVTGTITMSSLHIAKWISA